MEQINAMTPQVTLDEAKTIITALAPTQSVLLLSQPGVGKSAMVEQAAADAGLECRSLLGTQIAPEDVSGIPRIVGERSVFCPPRVLLPEDPKAKPFCLFLDELPACAPDIQKAFYSLLLERRIGEFPLPKGTWVVAAGNRAEDRSLVRALSAALVNRVTVLNIAVNVKDWLKWAHRNGIRNDVISFVNCAPDALCREPKPSPFSTPRSWAGLSRALDLLEADGQLTPSALKALAYGMLSPEDAVFFAQFLTFKLENIYPWYRYIKDPGMIPQGRDRTSASARHIIYSLIRKNIIGRTPLTPGVELSAEEINGFLRSLDREELIIMIYGVEERWAELGATEVMIETFDELVRAA